MKTVTRRKAVGAYPGDVGTCRYREGHTYAIQPGRGKKGIGRLRVRQVDLQPLSDALHEYRAEGFFTAEAFKAYWQKLYGTFDPDLAVWRIEFEVVPPTNPSPNPRNPQTGES